MLDVGDKNLATRRCRKPVTQRLVAESLNPVLQLLRGQGRVGQIAHSHTEQPAVTDCREVEPFIIGIEGDAIHADL